jgi:hypothetical protein
MELVSRVSLSIVSVVLVVWLWVVAFGAVVVRPVVAGGTSEAAVVAGIHWLSVGMVVCGGMGVSGTSVIVG